MTSSVGVAIDLMGGDCSYAVSIPAALQSLSSFPDLKLVLVGDKAHADQIPNNTDRITWVHADHAISMADKPSAILRQPSRSSMRIALELLQQAKVDAVVSAGNTGALMALGYHLLKMLPGIDRPAICAALPTSSNPSYLLDLGANVDSSVQQLYQFALMGSALYSANEGIKQPRIALLNIGEETRKGNRQVQQAHTLFCEAKQRTVGFNYVGFVEGNDLLNGQADVIVCDGFVGNVTLKACEGVASYIAQTLRSTLTESFYYRALGYLAAPLLRRMYCSLNYERYNGAVFLGLQGVVVKSHGRSQVPGFKRAIAQAYWAVKHNALTSIDACLGTAIDHQQDILTK